MLNGGGLMLDFNKERSCDVELSFPFGGRIEVLKERERPCRR
jgi:hypothetical protein